MRGINLPVVQRKVLDSSIMFTLERCPTKAMYKYVFDRASDEEDETSTSFGTAYHVFRDQLQKSDNFDFALAAALEHFKDPAFEHKKNFLDRARLKDCAHLAFKKYTAEKSPSSGIRVLGSEIPFELELPSGRLYGGKIDQPIEWNEVPYIRDFKTKSWMLKDTSDMYTLDMQMSGYVWAYRKLSGRRVNDVLVEIMYNTSAQAPKIIPVLTTRTDADIEQFVLWAEDKWDEWERRVASMTFPMYTSSCFDFMKKCEFHDACATGNAVDIEEWLKDHSKHKRWDFGESET